MKQLHSTGIVSLIMIFVILGVVLPLVSRSKEGMTAGAYPQAVDNPILADTYKVKKNAGYDWSSSASNIYVNYPRFPAKHCGTNNIQYWRRPTNGQCTPPGMCMGFYESTEQKIPPPPVGPSFSQIPRVNYYISKD